MDITVDGQNPMAARQGMAMPKMQICLDKTYDASSSWRNQTQGLPPECAGHDLQRRPDGSLSMHVECKDKSGRTAVIDGSISGDFQTSYKVDMTTTAFGDDGKQHHAHMIMTQTRVGDCAPGQKGGSVMMNGQSFTPPQ